MVVLPELASALLVALITYTAAFIAEIVRSGIQAFSHGTNRSGARARHLVMQRRFD